MWQAAGQDIDLQYMRENTQNTVQPLTIDGKCMLIIPSKTVPTLIKEREINKYWEKQVTQQLKSLLLEEFPHFGKMGNTTSVY